MEFLYCQKCLCGRQAETVGARCQTPGCDGIMEKEPEWKDLVDAIPEATTCPRRMGEYGPWERKEGLDHWDQFKREHKNRVCSFCGSLHPDDFLALVKQAAEADVTADYKSVVNIEPSDKGYKIYVWQPGVRNAHEGAIKFYTMHLPHDAEGKLAVTDAQQEEYQQAVTRSRERYCKLSNLIIGSHPDIAIN